MHARADTPWHTPASLHGELRQNLVGILDVALGSLDGALPGIGIRGLRRAQVPQTVKLGVQIRYQRLVPARDPASKGLVSTGPIPYASISAMSPRRCGRRDVSKFDGNCGAPQFAQ